MYASASSRTPVTNGHGDVAVSFCKIDLIGLSADAFKVSSNPSNDLRGVDGGVEGCVVSESASLSRFESAPGSDVAPANAWERCWGSQFNRVMGEIQTTT